MLGALCLMFKFVHGFLLVKVQKFLFFAGAMKEIEEERFLFSFPLRPFLACLLPSPLYAQPPPPHDTERDFLSARERGITQGLLLLLLPRHSLVWGAGTYWGRDERIEETAVSGGGTRESGN